MKRRIPLPPAENELHLISTGSTLFNLALSGKGRGGYANGKIANLIGDSHSGKSIGAISVLAEVARDSYFDKHDLHYIDAESALAFDVERLFGAKTAQRMNIVEDVDTVQDFQSYMMRILKKGPCVCVVDSWDAITSEEEEKKFEEHEKKGAEAKGSYGTQKAKKASEILRMVCRKIKRTNSFLLIVSQTRDNINPMSFQPKTRSGGRALKFYSSFEIWLAVGKPIKKHDKQVGINCVAKVTKSKLTGKVRTVSFPIYTDYGIDDIGSCIDWLVNEKVWKTVGKKIKAGSFHVTLSREKLIKWIEDDEQRELTLRKLVATRWQELEDSLKQDRKRKYG